MRNWHVAIGFVTFLTLAGTATSQARYDSALNLRATAGQRAEANPAISAPLAKRVTIAGTRYTLVNTVRAVGYIRSPYAKTISYLVRLCGTAGSWGFTGSTGVGVVAYAPTHLRDCLTGQAGIGVSGGGPGAQGPCAQFYLTPNQRSLVLIVGSSTDVCADMSTQVPGGVLGTTTDISDSGIIDAETPVWVTCQELDDDGYLWDYVTPRFGNSVNFPLSRAADWILHGYAGTSYADWIPHVPECSGVNTDL